MILFRKMQLLAKTRRRWCGREITLVLIALLVTVAIFVSEIQPVHPGASTAPASKSALTVDVTIPRIERWDQHTEVSGGVEPWHEASVRSLLTGQRLSEVYVDIGTSVTRGQVLARYETTMLLAQISQAKSALAQARANAQQAKTNLGRALQMIEGGAISKQELLRYQTSATVGAAQEDAAVAELSLHEIDLANASVLAPDDGTISARIATLGSVTPIGQELFRLIRQDRLQWRAEVTVAEVSSISVGQNAVVQLPDMTLVKGTVSMMAPSLDQRTRTALVYIELNSGSSARAGMYARGRILLGETNALVVPASALAMRDGRANVALVLDLGDQHYVTLREVKTGRRVGPFVEIISGLTGYESIVREGTALLSEGDVVTIATETAATLAATGSGTSERIQ
jgi:RND family efflux transporter MFP subunit